MDPEKLLSSLASGKTLHEDDLKEIALFLENIATPNLDSSISLDNVYEYLVILGKSNLRNYRHVIERYLQAEDALTVALALEILCLNWGDTADYLEQVISFALGVPWDRDEDVKQSAIKILGEYLHRELKLKNTKTHEQLSSSQLQVLKLLFSVFDDRYAEQWTRQAAYYALCRAAGKNWEELPPECTVISFSEDAQDIDRAMIEMLQSLASISHGVRNRS